MQIHSMAGRVLLHRVRRYYQFWEMVNLWKSDVLSYIEYRTPAVYHSSATILLKMDKLQKSYLADLGLSELDSLVHFRLAPLSARRDMAMLGVIHRSVLGLGPPQFHEFVRPPWRWVRRQTLRQRHRFHLEDVMDSRHLLTYRNSFFGLLRVYNLLAPEVVECNSVSTFQGRCQELLVARAVAGCGDW